MAAQISPSTQTPNPIPAKLDTKRNLVAYTGDTGAFLTGLSFIPATTVLVGLASTLTQDKALIGVVAMSWSMASLAPQLVAARLVHGKRRQKPYIVFSSLIGRQTMLLFALWLLFTNAQPPLLSLFVLIACILVFNICDSITGIAWLDMLSRNLSPSRRGPVLGRAQLIGSLLSIGGGIIVERLLAPGGLPFPQNFAVVFICAWAGFFLSNCFQFLYAENPMSEKTVSDSHEGSFLGHMREALRSDKVYRRLLITRILTGIETMSAAFYVVYIKERLQLPDASIGVFSLAFIVGGILGMALFGPLAGRSGARSVLRVSTVLQAAGPMLAFAVAVIPGLDRVPLVAYGLFIAILAINGAVTRSYILGFAGYTIDQAPDRRRAIYVGMLNTLGGLVALSPVLAGAFLDATAATLRNTSGPNGYAIMFGAVALCAGIGALISFTLPKPLRDAAA